MSTDDTDILTAAERACLRDELGRYFSTYPTVAEGMVVKTWKTSRARGTPS
jgi:hypothetical protein